MVIVPTSKIILLKNPIEIDYLNELTFSNATDQYNYFHGLTKLECDNVTYIRKDEVVRFPTDPNLEGTTYDDLLEYNYCMYQNDKWSNKWFYAFIKEAIFDNPGMSYLKLETDVWQTWMFDITFKNTFIEREHVNDDTIGLNILPENLEIGDPVSYSNVEILNDPNNFKICFAVTETPDEQIILNMPKNVNGIYGGLYYFVAKTNSDADNIIKIYDKNNKAGSIIAIFMIPNSMCELTDYEWIYHENQEDEIRATIRYVTDGKYYDSTTQSYKYGSTHIATAYIDIPSQIGTFIPKNNKLFTYPFIYCNATNNVGTTIPFRFEDSTEIDSITNKKCIMFWCEASLTQGISAKAIPTHYKNLDYNYMYGITIGKFPICSWNSDYYLNWITQNGVNAVVNGIGSVIPNVISAGMGNPSGVTGTLTGIYNTLHQFTIAEITPNQAKGNMNSGDVNFSYEDSGGFSLYVMGIKEQYARIIDNYFSMFGYQVNQVKLPNITGRTYWNYVKTIGQAADRRRY